MATALEQEREHLDENFSELEWKLDRLMQDWGPSPVLDAVHGGYVVHAEEGRYRLMAKDGETVIAEGDRKELGRHIDGLRKEAITDHWGEMPYTFIGDEWPEEASFDQREFADREAVLRFRRSNESALQEAVDRLGRGHMGVPGDDRIRGGEVRYEGYGDWSVVKSLAPDFTVEKVVLEGDYRTIRAQVEEWQQEAIAKADPAEVAKAHAEVAFGEKARAEGYGFHSVWNSDQYRLTGNNGREAIGSLEDLGHYMAVERIRDKWMDGIGKARDIPAYVTELRERISAYAAIHGPDRLADMAANEERGAKAGLVIHKSNPWESTYSVKTASNDADDRRKVSNEDMPGVLREAEQRQLRAHGKSFGSVAAAKDGFSRDRSPDTAPSNGLTR